MKYRGEACLAQTLFIHVWIRPALFLCDLHRCPDLNQWTFADPRTILPRAGPFLLTFDEFGPEWKRAALGRFRWMNRAAMAFEERALFFRRLAEPHLMPGPVDVFLFERPRGHPHESRRALEVGLSQVDKAFLIAAIDAPALAGKAQGVHAIRRESRNPSSRRCRRPH
jgi:hypothetical protein